MLVGSVFYIRISSPFLHFLTRIPLCGQFEEPLSVSSKNPFSQFTITYSFPATDLCGFWNDIC